MSLADATQAESGPPSPSGRADQRVLGIPFTFFSFLVVGLLAFVVNEVALFLVYDTPLFWFLPDKEVEAGIAGVEHPDIRLFVASVLSVEAAIAFKFFAYEHWTFADRPRRGNIFWRFIQLNGASILGTIVTVATVNLLTPLLGISPYISTPIGVLAAFMLNWFFSNHLIWRAHKQAPGAADAG